MCLLRQVLPQKNDCDRCGLDLFHLQHQREKILSNSKTDSGKYADSACCDVLEISEFDAEQFAERIEQIQIPAPNELQFCFSDGTEQIVSWKDRSRSESWTTEMREKARQKKWRQS